MVRKIHDSTFKDGMHYVKAAGLSTEQKPTGGMITGSSFMEVDTGKKYLYDEVGETWAEVPQGYIAPDD